GAALHLLTASGEKGKARAPLGGEKGTSLPPIAERRMEVFPSPREGGQSCFFLLPASGEKVPKADEGRFSPWRCSVRATSLSASWDRGYGCHLAQCNARGPSSGAARHLLPACGEKGKSMCPACGEKGKSMCPACGEKGKSMCPACGEKERACARLRGEGKSMRPLAGRRKEHAPACGEKERTCTPL